MKTWLKQRAEQLKTDIPAIFMAMKEKDTPVSAKIFAGMTIVYALSPIDFIPDFIPVLGYLDDLILLPLLAAMTIRLIPREVFERCREKSAGMWDEGKPKKWYYALPIAVFWLVIIGLILKAVL